MIQIPLLDRLAGARRILVAGAGGGFDVFAGLPLFFALRDAGKDVFLANLTFSFLGFAGVDWIQPGLARVDARTEHDPKYAPERYLAEWLETIGAPQPIFCLEKRGVRPTRAAYARLVADLRLDAILLVDGGTDILMRGDEAGLGTPAEDMTSLAAVAGLDGVPIKLVSCLGFGIDAFHGVCHAQFLENVAALEAAGGYLGAFSIQLAMEGARRFRDAVEFVHARMPDRQSIVNGSIVSALEGRFGDAHRTERTRGSELFINPLMSIYFSFDLGAVAARSLYLDRLEDTQSIFDVQLAIEAFRETVEPRPRRPIPV